MRDEPATGLLVACLCAEWCNVCRAYRVVFDEAAAENPDLRFLWIDVEDSAALMDPVDIEDFPTILIGENDNLRFFGTITPQRDVLLRLVAEHRKGGAGQAAREAEVRDLLARLRTIGRGKP